MALAEIAVKQAHANIMNDQIRREKERQAQDRLVVEEEVAASRHMRWLVNIVIFVFIAAVMFFLYVGNDHAAYCLLGMAGAGFVYKVIALIKK